MDETLFYVFGIALVISALGVAGWGLRYEGFPPTRAMLAAVIVYFVGMVAATTTFAVLNARDEQRQREAEEASAEAPPSGEATTTTGPAAGATTGAAPAGQATTLGLAAEPDAIAYDTKQLSAKAGPVTIEFDNPSAVTHDVCLEGTGGEVGCSDTI